MKVEHLSLEGAILFTPRIFEDERGYFLESFNPAVSSLIPHDFVQENISVSTKGVLRGLHYQNAPHAQGKLVRVLSGSVLDVLVDIRPESPTLGQHLSVLLDAKSHHSLWIPPGFAHGFLALENKTTFHYKCTALYSPESEGIIRYDDPELNIDWQISNPEVVLKDKNGDFLSDYLSKNRG